MEIRGLIIGTRATGKTSFIRRIFDDTTDHGLTMQSTDYPIDLRIPRRDGTVTDHRIILTDTPGQRDYAYQSFVDGIRADIIIVFYEVNTLETFNHISMWLDDIRNIGLIRDRELPLYFIGNKTDLDMIVSSRMTDAYVSYFRERWDAPVHHFFISAKKDSITELRKVLNRIFISAYKYMRAFSIIPTQEIFQLERMSRWR